MKILVADDSQAMRKIFRSALEGMGYSPASVLEAPDGTDAIQMLRQRAFRIDIVLADSNMPNMDGFALLKEIHEDKRLAKIPFIMVAGEAERERVLEAMRGGARGYILKPFTPEVLRRTILEVEKELLDRQKPTDTAVIRFASPPASASERNVDEPFMARMPAPLVAEIHEAASPSEYHRGDILVEPEDVVQSLRIIIRGEVEILPATGGHPGDVRGRGECFGELSFLSGDPAGVRVRARTALSVAGVEREAFDALLAKRPHLSLYLTRLLARRARTADARLATREAKGLSGRFSTIPLVDIVQTLHRGRMTGLLRVNRDDDSPGRTDPGSYRRGKGGIYFVDGGILQSRIGERSGEDAFFELMTWVDGHFTFEAGRRRVERGIFRATMALLMEGALKRDKRARLRA